MATWSFVPRSFQKAQGGGARNTLPEAAYAMWDPAERPVPTMLWPTPAHVLWNLLATCAQLAKGANYFLAGKLPGACTARRISPQMQLKKPPGKQRRQSVSAGRGSRLPPLHPNFQPQAVCQAAGLASAAGPNVMRWRRVVQEEETNTCMPTSASTCASDASGPAGPSISDSSEEPDVELEVEAAVCAAGGGRSS